MKGNKFLAAALAASMVFSTVPATALSVFADSVSVEASDIKASTDDQVVVVEAAGSKSDAVTAKLIQSQLKSKNINGFNSSDEATNGTSADEITAALKKLIGGTALESADDSYDYSGVLGEGQYENILVDDAAPSSTNTAKDAKKLSFKVTYDDGESYNITITADDANALTDANKKAALDALFASTTFTREQGVTPTSASLVKQINDLKTAGSAAGGDWHDDTDNTKDGVYAALAGSTIEANGGQLTANSDGTYSGKITVDRKTYTVKSARFTEVDPSALTNAIAAIKDNVYANPQSGAPDDVNGLTGKIKADLDTAAGIKLNVSVRAVGTPIPASARNNWTGSYTVNIGGTVVTFALKKDSTTKSTETETAVKKALNGTDGTVSHKLYTKSGNKYSEELKNASIINVAPTSSLSLGVQPLTATTAAKADDVTAAVKAAVEAALPDNGVTVEVSTLKDFADAVDGTTTTATTTSTDATASAAGYDYVLVKTSIANDYYGWTDGTDANTDKTENTIKNYVVMVNLPKLKANKTTKIEAKDASYVAKSNYHVDTLATPAGKTEAATTSEYGDLFDIKSLVTLTPADANDELTYDVTDENGDTTNNAVTEFSAVKYVEAKGGTEETAGKTLVGPDGKSVKDFAKKDGKLLVFAPGTYKVTVHNADSSVKATATITVNGRFKDVSATAYYKNAVNWAYSKGITSGVSDTEFGSNTDVTRAQFVTWLYKNAVDKDASVAIKDADVKQVFSDVATDKYYAKAVQWAKDAGITSGTDATHFSPNAKINRAQAVTMLYAAAGRPDTGATGYEGEQTTQFTDLKAGAYYIPAVTWAVNHGVTTGTSTTTFSPNATAKRAQAITFLYKASNLY